MRLFKKTIMDILEGLEYPTKLIILKGGKQYEYSTPGDDKVQMIYDSEQSQLSLEDDRISSTTQSELEVEIKRICYFSHAEKFEVGTEVLPGLFKVEYIIDDLTDEVISYCREKELTIKLIVTEYDVDPSEFIIIDDIEGDLELSGVITVSAETYQYLLKPGTY